MRGHTHDSARAVVPEHVVCDPDRNFLARRGIDGFHTLELNSCLLSALLPLTLCLLFRFLNVRLNFVVVFENSLVPKGERDPRMFRGKHEIRAAEERVCARRENSNMRR